MNNLSTRAPEPPPGSGTALRIESAAEREARCEAMRQDAIDEDRSTTMLGACVLVCIVVILAVGVWLIFR
jgi:hypothetical protein